MEIIVRNIRDIDVGQRQALEHVVGRQLKDDQQVVLQIITPGPASTTNESNAALPDWCNVFAGLSDDEVAEAEKIILQRTNLSRSFK